MKGGDRMKVTSKDLVDIGKLSKEIKLNWLESETKKKTAYDLLDNLNSKLSDLCGETMEMEDILAI